MLIQALIDELLSEASVRIDNTVDTIKAGSVERDVSHIATCFMATAEVIKQAQKSGVEFLITHEPTYYNHRDIDRPAHPIVQMKKQLVDNSGLTIWRYHDHIHKNPTDGIVAGILDALQWKGTLNKTVFELDSPMTMRQMASDIREKLRSGGVRVTGDPEYRFARVLMAVGAPGAEAAMMDQLVTSGFRGVLFVGEVSEWGALEQIRDAAAFGIPLGALTCGHDITEEQGMAFLAKKIAASHPELRVDFIPTGEVYSYL